MRILSTNSHSVTFTFMPRLKALEPSRYPTSKMSNPLVRLWIVITLTSRRSILNISSSRRLFVRFSWLVVKPSKPPFKTLKARRARRLATVLTRKLLLTVIIRWVRRFWLRRWVTPLARRSSGRSQSILPWDSLPDLTV